MLLITNAGASSWYAKSDEGWHWYKDPKIKKEPVEKKFNKKGQAVASSYTEKLEKFQKRLEELKARALIHPTAENVAAFIKIHDFMLEKSTHFQKMWDHVNMTLPDPELIQYSSPKAKEIRATQEREWLYKKLKTLAQDYGLFFVFKSGCRFCHEFSPLVKAFSQKYGFEVKAISADGGELAEFPEAVADNGTIALINPGGVYPALYLVNPKTNLVQPIAWGMVNEIDLEQNIKHWLTYREEN
jgi:conjugal transfer pilus assembly protein TraF